MRIIDVDAAVDRYYAEYEKQDIYDGSQDRDWLKKCIDEAPEIDPESLKPKGRWEEWWPGMSLILTGEEMLYRCSECDAKYSSKENMHYCPNCGAKMDEGNEDG